ncbi:MAG: Asp-tRNA(Asn)/Glu-tRNA(Gln) amidotransferase subunit GatA [Clostridia bacterium]|nr:Asp-tRNA(Asn)/Glu-tRNA(Gln) amidotransferase subunit GatA [Clostridia bacterium]
MSIINLSAWEITEKVKNKELKAVEVVEAYIARIDEVDGTLNTFISTEKERALNKAKEIDEKIANGESVGKLAGVVYALKDNMLVTGTKTTCASKMLENFESPYDMTVHSKLEAEDAILIGKANLDEFAMGSSNENSAFGDVKNPWDLERVPGGSSGGSAAAVAAREVSFSLGSDTGGSIRQPASLCGLVGLKPTYGRVSRYGVVAFASSLDQVGPFTKNAKDAALVASAMFGQDEMDGTTAPKGVEDFFGNIDENKIKEMKIAIPTEFYANGISDEVKDKVMAAVKALEEMGATVEEISMPMTRKALPAYYVISSAEASSNLSRFDGIRFGYRTDEFEDLDELYTKNRGEGFGEEVKRRIMLGTYTLSSGYYDAYYNKAMQVRTLIKNEFENVFDKYDVIITPTSPTTAFKIGEKSDNALEMYMADICTVPVNIGGVPALSMNCGFDSNGLPIGLQMIGNYFDEQTLFNAAYALEQKLNLNNVSEVI